MQFQLGERVGGGEDGGGVLSDPPGHFEQDAMDFGEFLIQQTNQFVILLDGFERFDEYGLSAGAGAVNHALHAPFLLDFNRNHKPLATNRDQLILHGAAFRQPAEMTAQRFLNRTLLLLDFAADAGQLGGGAVVERAIGQGLVAESAQKFGEIGDRLGEGSDRGPFGAHGRRRLPDYLAPLRRAVNQQHDIPNVGRFKRGAGNP